MEKITKILIWTSVYLFFPFGLVNAQKLDITDELIRFAGNVHQFNSIFPQEKVYLQFDNTSYAVGDTIWFKAYVVEASTHRQSPSHVLYVDLLSVNGEQLQKLKLKIDSGQACGYFPLCNSDGNTIINSIPYNPGYYEIRAYTTYMLNFAANNVFSRVFPVHLNQMERSVILEGQNSDKRPKANIPNTINVEFYPEGGHLIKGVSNLIAFKATNSLGIGVEISGKLDNGTIVNAIHDGMGAFRIVPTAKTEELQFEYEGKNYRFSLPPCEKSGVCLSLVKKDNNIYSASISSRGINGNDKFALVVICRGEVYYFRELSLEGNMDITLPLESKVFPEGVCQLLLFDKDGKKWCSRMFYNHLSTTTPVVIVESNKSKYSPFERILLNVSVHGNSGELTDRLCVSVRDGNEDGFFLEDDLRSYLLLASDLRGYVVNPGFYFESDDEYHRQSLDLLTLVQGWERYDWEYMSGQKLFAERHRMESGLTLNGWTLTPLTKKELNDVIVDAIVVFPDTQKIERFSLATGQGGYFGLDVSDFYGEATVKIWTTTPRHYKKRTDCRLLLERSEKPSLRSLSALDILSFENMPDLLAMYNDGKSPFSWSRKRKKYENEVVSDTSVQSIPDGFILPDVNVAGVRQFVDYDTFKSFNVLFDVENDKDKGLFTSDLNGYFNSKNINIYPYNTSFSAIGDYEADCATYCPPNPVSFGVGGDTRTFYSGGNMVYSEVEYRNAVHTVTLPQLSVSNGMSRTNRNSSIIPNADSWDLSVDVGNIKNVYLFDKKVKKNDRQQLTEDFLKAAGRDAYFIKAISNRGAYDFVVVELKPHSQLMSETDMLDIDRRELTFQGYTVQSAEFYNVKYPEGAIPGEVDYRRTLYWNPNFVLENGRATIECYNNSYSSSFRVSVSGITEAGIPYAMEKKF